MLDGAGSDDVEARRLLGGRVHDAERSPIIWDFDAPCAAVCGARSAGDWRSFRAAGVEERDAEDFGLTAVRGRMEPPIYALLNCYFRRGAGARPGCRSGRSEEHTSELQS